MEYWEHVAREQIRDLVARYNANGDSGRIAQVLELFIPDAVMHIPGKSHRGLVEIEALFATATAKIGEGGSSHASFIRHYTATHQIDLTSTTRATGRCYYQVLTDGGLDHWGRYLDAYRCVDDQWRFAERRVSVDGSTDGGWGELD